MVQVHLGPPCEVPEHPDGVFRDFLCGVVRCCKESARACVDEQCEPLDGQGWPLGTVSV